MHAFPVAAGLRRLSPSPILQAGLLALGLAASNGIAFAYGCAAFQDGSGGQRPALTTVLTGELMRRHGWQPGVCRLVEPLEAEAKTPQPWNSSLAAAVALEQIRAGTGY